MTPSIFLPLALALAVAAPGPTALPVGRDAARVDAVFTAWHHAGLRFEAGEWERRGPCLGERYALPDGGRGVVWSCVGSRDSLEVSEVIGFGHDGPSYAVCAAGLATPWETAPRYRDRFIAAACGDDGA